MNQRPDPLVSVITPFYNEEKYLSEAINSVLHQDYKYWELLLMDDGSTDRSTQIAKEYAANYPDKIIYLEHEHHSNRGLCASRNKALQAARGSFVALLDADDIWLPEKLSTQVDIARQHPELSMVCEASEYWYNWNEAEKENVVIPTGGIQDHLYLPGELLTVLYPLGKGAAPCPSSLLINKSVLLEKRGFENAFTRQYQLYEDQAFLSKIYLTEKVYISSACNNLYRQRQGSLVQWIKDDGHYHEVRKFYLEWFQQYLEKQNVNNPEISKALRKALQPYHQPLLHFFVSVLPGKAKKYFSKPSNG